MIDSYGRKIDYIRISVTDLCNLRCTYCMPEEGVAHVSHDEILRYDEIIRLLKIFVSLGITKVKLTGGEPLVRRGLPGLVKEIKHIPGITSVTLTTNGILLKQQIRELHEAGIDSVNVSVDTLDREMFHKITRRDKFPEVLDGIQEVLRYPDVRLKINCVPISGINENQWIKLAYLAKNNPIDVRFIEMMPIGLGKQYDGKTQDVILKILEDEFGTSKPISETVGNGPGTYAAFPEFIGRIGFISAVSHKFCGSCNRIRLTSEGYLKLCLQYEDGVDLKTPLRQAVTDCEIRALIETAILKKPKDHHFTQQEEDNFEKKKMSSIGG